MELIMGSGSCPKLGSIPQETKREEYIKRIHIVVETTLSLMSKIFDCFLLNKRRDSLRHCILNSPRNEVIDSSAQQRSSLLCLTSLLQTWLRHHSADSINLQLSELTRDAAMVDSTCALRAVLSQASDNCSTAALSGAKTRALQLASQNGFIEMVSRPKKRHASI